MYETYLSKLEELKSEKVELGTSDDLQKLIKKSEDVVKEGFKSGEIINKIYRELLSLEREYNGKIDGYIKSVSNAGKLKKELSKMLDNITKQTKDLGINPNELKGYSKARSLEEDLRAISNPSQNYPKKISI